MLAMYARQSFVTAKDGQAECSLGILKLSRGQLLEQSTSSSTALLSGWMARRSKFLRKGPLETNEEERTTSLVHKVAFVRLKGSLDAEAGCLIIDLLASTSLIASPGRFSLCSNL